MMATRTWELNVATKAPVEVIDLTDRVKVLVAGSPIHHGLLTVISQHTTAFIGLNEYEPGLVRDMVDFLGQLVPSNKFYRHDSDPVDGRPNTHAHLAGLLMAGSAAIPVEDGELMLGTWQSILLFELDGPRSERVVKIHLMGME